MAIRDQMVLVTLLIAIVGAMALLLVIGRAITTWHVRRVPQLHPRSGHWVGEPGARLHIVDEGEGPPIVLLHGANGTSWDLLYRLVPLLRGRWRCLIPDRPGHGHSDPPSDAEGLDPRRQADRLHAAMRELGVERPLLVGHSAGALTALAWACRHPDDVAGVVSLSGFLNGDQVELDHLDGRLEGPGLFATFLHTLLTPLGLAVRPFVLRNAFHPMPVPRDYLQRAVHMAVRPGHHWSHHAELARLAPGARALRPCWDDLPVPVVITMGQEDRVVHRTHHVDPVAEVLPDATVLRWPGVGHMVPQAHPDKALEAIEIGWRRVRAVDGASSGS